MICEAYLRGVERLVGSQIFGFEEIDEVPVIYGGSYYDCMVHVDPEGRYETRLAYVKDCGCDRNGDEPDEFLPSGHHWICYDVMQEYAHHIEAAWPIVDKLTSQETGIYFRLQQNTNAPGCGQGWNAVFLEVGAGGRIVNYWSACVTSMIEVPLAICLAALKTKGIEVEK